MNHGINVGIGSCLIPFAVGALLYAMSCLSISNVYLQGRNPHHYLSVNGLFLAIGISGRSTEDIHCPGVVSSTLLFLSK